MNPQLSAFIGISCLVHVGLLLWPAHPSDVQLNIGGHAQALRVTLAQTPKPAHRRTPSPAAAADTLRTRPAAPTPHKQPERRRNTPRQDEPRQLAEAETARTALPRSAPRRKTPSDTAHAARPQSSSLKVGERVSAALEKQLAENFKYPWLARKRGWQGLVTLSLRVNADGFLTQWKVLRTSGYTLLDHSALKAARRIVRLPQAQRLLNGRAITLSIPVRYRLLDS
jgi:protein TonB